MADTLMLQGMKLGSSTRPPSGRLSRMRAMAREAKALRSSRSSISRRLTLPTSRETTSPPSLCRSRTSWRWACNRLETSPPCPTSLTPLTERGSAR